MTDSKSTSKDKQQSLLFNHHALRQMVGVAAISLPVLAELISFTPLTSISASYYTENRNVFVGTLFIIGALMWAYEGHKPEQIKKSKSDSFVKKIWDFIVKILPEKAASKAASIAAIVTALVPTACDSCDSDTISPHNIAALVLFSIIAYFCIRFRERTKDKHWPEAKFRGNIYLVSAVVIIICTGYLLIAKKGAPLIYGAEAAALAFFALAWFTAGKPKKISFITNIKLDFE